MTSMVAAVVAKDAKATERRNHKLVRFDSRNLPEIY